MADTASGLAEFDLVIFDCDGVLINSEEIASQVCAEGKRVQPFNGAFRTTSFHFGWNGGR